MSRSVAFLAIGCRTNQQENAALSTRLAASGMRIEPDAEKADLIIVNTCCVTAHTESKTRRALRALARRAPQARMLVTGCMAQRDPGLFSGLPGIDWVVGNTRKAEIPQLLACTPGVYHDTFEGTTGPLPPALEPAEQLANGAYQRTRYVVKIQEGCNQACAYCIVPSVRGPSRSLPATQVIDSCKKALDAGFKEIVVGGTHIGQYHDQSVTLLALLESICTLGGDFRVRLSSLDPRELSGGLAHFIAATPRICDYVHVSVQSFDPAVLAAMNRPHSTDTLLQSAALIRKTRPLFALGGDFIVGFCTETEQMFERTCEMVQLADFSFGHVFRYSPRPGTPAFALADSVPDSEKTRRSQVLRNRLASQSDQFVSRCCGSVQRILVEQSAPVRGLSANYLEIELDSSPQAAGEWVDCRIEKQLAPGSRKVVGSVAACTAGRGAHAI